MFIVTHKNIFITISVTLVLVSVLLVSVFGLNLGIDFLGGSRMEISYTVERPEVSVVQSAIDPIGIGEALIQPSGTDSFFIKTRYLSEAERVAVVSALSANDTQVAEKSFTSIGPSVGSELRKKAIMSMLFVILAIITFIAFSFRSVSRPVSSWKYGLIAVVTLLHDIAIPIGIFSLLSYFNGAEVDTLFVVAILTVLGVSISDTIVVFDRIRENLKNQAFPTFRETVGRSLSQVYQRSISTSLTVIIVLLSLSFFGPESTKNFALMLTAGMISGTYSSIFLASPLLVWVEERQNRKKSGTN
ncbi:MAG: protein translocase subunit SecF [Candidatus Pacebacteria bacterium]|jgi:preprotein translocase subunit SecF|nr:protein translocase subunit SecF [Candidatus Paceibacterota bacterium]